MRDFRVELDGLYKGYTYSVILLCMGHRCGYVRLPLDHELAGTSLECDDVYCHGGITYSRDYLVGHEAPGWWIGFDCAHCDDINDWESVFEEFKDNEEAMTYARRTQQIEALYPVEGTKWTMEMVEAECKGIIDQLVIMDKAQK